MKYLILLLFGAALAAEVDSLEKMISDEWKQFKLEHKKRYRSTAEDMRRLSIYAMNKYKIIQHNELFDQGKVSFKLKVNKYSDMPNDEFLAKMTGLIFDNDNSTNSNSSVMSTMYTDVPIGVDWRKMGAVTDVKDQKQCGSCWAFAVTGAIEGQVFRVSHQLKSLSEQNLVDCAGSHDCHGCRGGNNLKAFNYVKDNGGIDTEESYRYEAVDGQCRYDPKNSGAAIKGYVKINSDESALKAAVANMGPVAVGIDASHDFQHYADGVYYEKDCSPDRRNHAVLVVGYGTDEKGGDYWLVKNSWGKSWGNKGYIMMARNRGNNCGIASDASFPDV